MIGQEKIKYILKNRVPNSIVLLGKPGSGKTTLANYISLQLKAEFVNIEDLSVPQMKQITEEVRMVTFPRVYCLENVENMTHLAQNVLLKTLEEINDKVTVVLCVDDKTKLLPTIMSRCTVIPLDTYSDGELQKYSDTRLGGIDIKYCDTPGDVTYKKYLIDAGIYDQLINLVNLIVQKVTSAHVGNVFRIVNTLETLNADKEMITWFLNALIYEFRDDKEAHTICLQYRYHILNNNTDWKRTVEQLFVELNGRTQ